MAWVLGTVFLRWTEDNGLIDPVLSGPGDRLPAAEDAQRSTTATTREHNDGDWLAEQFEVLRATDAGRLLFDPRAQPAVPAADLARRGRALVDVLAHARRDGALRHDFTDPDWDTRFLGDLYQDLSEAAKKYALLQTPEFVEEFILDRTLDPGDRRSSGSTAAADRSGLRLAATSCSARSTGCSTAWRERAPPRTTTSCVRRALDSVHGVDINPFAVAIARFRLLVAALNAAGVDDAGGRARQRWRPIVALGDSLLHGPARRARFGAVDDDDRRTALR